jgi:hypothetical protein
MHAEGADIFRVEGRTHGADDGCGRWDEQVVFTAAVRVLFWKTLARTRVHQDIDASNPQCVRVNFRLLQSVSVLLDQGSWLSLARWSLLQRDSNAATIIEGWLDIHLCMFPAKLQKT